MKTFPINQPVKFECAGGTIKRGIVLCALGVNEFGRNEYEVRAEDGQTFKCDALLMFGVLAPDTYQEPRCANCTDPAYCRASGHLQEQRRSSKPVRG